MIEATLGVLYMPVNTRSGDLAADSYRSRPLYYAALHETLQFLLYVVLYCSIARRYRDSWNLVAQRIRKSFFRKSLMSLMKHLRP